jgi:hypothetical protein
MRRLHAVLILAMLFGCEVASAGPADPQASAPAQPAPNVASAPKRTEVVIYPILGWLPIYGAHAILPNRPEFPGLPPDEGGGSRVDTDGSLNGAALVGVSVVSPKWVFQFEFLWAGLSGEAQRPHATATADIVFGGVYGGRQIGHGLAVMGGVRRIAANLGLEIDTLGSFERKPGVWDPLVGIAWRREISRKWIATIDVMGGGFGVGADVDASLHARLNWDPLKHMRVAFGYGMLYLDLSHGVGDKTLTTQQTLYGPELGIGIKF